MALKHDELVDQDYKYGFRDDDVKYTFKSRKGIDHDIVEQIAKIKDEPQWMRDQRHRALDIFFAKPLPPWANVELLEQIDFADIFYYMRASDVEGVTWDEVPEEIKRTFDRLGVPEAERKFLGGVTAQYDSEVVYHSIRKDLEAQGVIFTDMGTGLREYEATVKKYFGSVIPAADNKFAALNSAVWSGGSFVWVPAGVHVSVPVQAYFRINAENMGQFERTLIIAEPGSFVHYIEGCTAPKYSSNSLHSAVVELIAMEGAHIRYTTIQNWYKNIYNLVTKRAVAYKNAHVEWVDGNIGSKLTMKYPAVYLMGEGARGEVLSIAYANSGMHQDAGSKMVHAAPNTTSIITSKSVSKGGGQTTYRGLVKVYEGCDGVKSNVRCDALLMDAESRSYTYPTMEIDAKNVRIEHEATVSKVGEEQLFYVMSRGLTEVEATTMIVNGFFEPFVKELPMEYAVELNRLIALEMEGSVG
ncbi:MAG TPA: Fe-S cluster assembly protein SufB [Candidatus Eremiobacteraceae bacterium]